MAEFCHHCRDNLNGTNDSAKRYVISQDCELCEGCGEYKRVIVCAKTTSYTYAEDRFMLPILIVGTIFKLIWRRLALPYKLWKRHKDNKQSNNS